MYGDIDKLGYSIFTLLNCVSTGGFGIFRRAKHITEKDAMLVSSCMHIIITVELYSNEILPCPTIQQSARMNLLGPMAAVRCSCRCHTEWPS